MKVLDRVDIKDVGVTIDPGRVTIFIHSDDSDKVLDIAHEMYKTHVPPERTNGHAKVK